MKPIFILILGMFLYSSGSAQISLTKIKTKLTGSNVSTEEVGKGLKEALTTGVSKASDFVSSADGYYKNADIKIPFPPEVKNVEDRLRQIGLGNQVDDFVLSLNRAAEDAAKQAKPIFISAVEQMTIQDAWSILNGEDDAATQYLDKVTSDQLTEKFKPVIQASLEKTNASQLYKKLISTYNKLPLVKKENPDLDDYATGKAVEGIFIMVAKEEKNIRENPGARTSDLMKKVFNEQN